MDNIFDDNYFDITIEATEYKRNNVQGVNEVYKSLNKQDRLFVQGGNYRKNSRDYLIDPEGDFATKFINNDYGFMITMYVDNKPAAYFGCFRAWDKHKKQYTDEAEIDFAVHSDYRGKGLGSKIIKKGMDEIKRNPKYKTIKWYTLVDNEASNALAKKFGFRYFETITSHDKHNKLNGYIYEK